MKKITCILLTALFIFSLAAAVSAESHISHSGWKVTASSVNANEKWAPEKMIDDDVTTYWHSAYTDGGAKDMPPYIITFTLPSKTAISGFSYVPRNDNPSGIVTAYNLYVSDSDSGEAELIDEGTFVNNAETKNVRFRYNIEVRTVIFEITAGAFDYGTCAEFNLISPSGSVKKTIAQASKGKRIEIGKTDTAGDTLPRDGWRVTASSTYKERKAELMIDSNPDTYWHSNYSEDGSKDEAPFRLEFTLPSKTAFSGFRYIPRHDNGSGIVTAYNIYVSDTDSGSEKKVFSGTMDGDMKTKDVDFGFNTEGKKVIFEITAGAYGYGTCAEFYLFAAKDAYGDKAPGDVKNEPVPGGKITDKSRWVATASSEKAPKNVAKNAIDGDKKTIWHSGYTDDGVATILSKEPGPHWLSVTLPEVTAISGFSYTPREEQTGRIWRYEFYVSESDSGEDWFKADYGEFNDDASEKAVKFPANIKVRRVKLLALTSALDYGVIAELDLFSEDPDIKTAESYSEFETIYGENKLYKIPSANGEMTATASSVWRERNSAAMAVDGEKKTAWHSAPDDVNKFPVTLDVDMGAVHNVAEIIYYPRTEDVNAKNGIWLLFNIWAGETMEDLKPVMENVTLKDTWDPQTIKFDEPVRARYFEFEISKGLNGFATCGDLEFYEKLTESTSDEGTKTKYTLKIGSKTIKIEDEKGTREAQTDVAPYIDNGYTQIPLRGLLEQMGATFEWDGEYNKITVDASGVIIKMQIYNKLVTVTHRVYGEIRYTLHSVPQIKDSRTFVPLRFISENLGYSVEWNGETQEITITK